MTDEVGQTAMLALPDLQIQLDSIDGAFNRAYALFLADRRQFRRAEEIRYADENQNAQRLWDAFVGPTGCSPTTDADRLNRFQREAKTDTIERSHSHRRVRALSSGRRRQ